MRAILENRLRSIEADKKAIAKGVTRSTPEPAQPITQASQPRAYIDGIGWMSALGLSDLILSERFTTLDDNLKAKAASALIEMDENTSERTWKILEEDDGSIKD